VAKGDSGEHAFAVTAEEQAQNVDQYLNGGG
jgi:cell division protein YceG involved in septum cleavage